MTFETDDLDSFPIASLKSTARRARDRSHAPYSEFSVGAAVLGRREKVFGAGNIEWGGREGVHAEQLAILKAVDRGRAPIQAIAISVDGEKGTPPCSLCLHAIANFSTEDVPIYTDHGDQWEKTMLYEASPLIDRYQERCEEHLDTETVNGGDEE